MRRAAVLLAVAALAGCGSGARRAAPPPTTTVTTSATTTTATQPLPPACTLLFARLQRVTAAVQASSELIARSNNKAQLAERIRIEQVQLGRAADLLEAGSVPSSIAPVNADLVAALRRFARDFGAARAPAAGGGFAPPSQGMTDPLALRRLAAAGAKIVRIFRPQRRDFSTPPVPK